MSTAYMLMRAERAFKAYLATVAGLPENVYKGMERPAGRPESLERTLPCVICSVTTQDWKTWPMGNCDLKCEIMLLANMDDTDEDVWEGYCQALLDALLDTAFLDNINAASTDFTAQGFDPSEGELTHVAEERRWVATMTFMLKECTGQDLADA